MSSQGGHSRQPNNIFFLCIFFSNRDFLNLMDIVKSTVENKKTTDN
ncbi:Uncharacterized protein dnm_049080 [Desulfonema magnum]|uniref:Uncharacterized protein n=1 Tax=Desulfonema magnum TaxID=45655 RepID=A0A975BNN1_9BACT|nr:Uncharacterized protein dnm_049080 [Desulfonema magnum]